MSRILLVANPKSGVRSNKNILDLTIREFEKSNIFNKKQYTSILIYSFLSAFILVLGILLKIIRKT